MAGGKWVLVHIFMFPLWFGCTETKTLELTLSSWYVHKQPDVQNKWDPIPKKKKKEKKTVRMVKKESKGSLLVLYRTW